VSSHLQSIHQKSVSIRKPGASRESIIGIFEHDEVVEENPNEEKKTDGFFASSTDVQKTLTELQTKNSLIQNIHLYKDCKEKFGKFNSLTTGAFLELSPDDIFEEKASKFLQYCAFGLYNINMIDLSLQLCNCVCKPSSAQLTILLHIEQLRLKALNLHSGQE